MVLQLCGRVCRRLSLKSLSEEIGFFIKTFLFIMKVYGTLAQMVEQWTENPCVPGSIPGGTTSCSDGEIGRHAGLKIQ